MTDEPPAAASPRTDWPGVAVVMPVLNEREHLEESVRRILAQEYPGPLEVVLAVGPSRDGTLELARALSTAHPEVRIVDNPTGRTPSGLNAAVRATSYPVVVRVDGHGLLPPGYVRTAVQVMQETGADNVGGVMAPEGRTPFERAVAWAMSSRWGIGDARFHVGGEAGDVETVYLGTFRREVLEKLGGFDETFARAQDWELNHRIRQYGGTVWFTPRLRVIYRPRSTARALARQFFTTGTWRQQVVRRYPGTVNARYLAPPVVVLVIVVASAGAGAGLAAGVPGAAAGLLAPLAYLGGVGVVTASAAGQLDRAAVRRLPLVIVTMHLCWGSGFLWGLLSSLGRRSPR